MKLLILYCIASMASICTYAQKVSVSFNKTSFHEVVRQIEKQGTYTFVYTSRQEQKIPAITIQKDSITIPDLLKMILRETSIGFLIDGNSIILTSHTEHKKTIYGRVITQSGYPVDGATIEIRSEKRSITTGRDGSFELSYINPGTALFISGAEIIPAEVKTGDNEFLEIKVQQRIRELDETIILGYGSTTRRFNTGNAVKINTTDLNKMPRNNIFSFMQGKVPGLLITSSGSAPDASSLLQIRGQHSINPNPLLNYMIPPVDQPFIVVNGVPFAPQNNNINQLSSISSPGSLDIYQNPYGGISPFKLIDPSDIESIEVLKDAVATSIYGSRSANGVILITTKQPAEEKLSVEAIISSGITLRKAGPEMLSTEQYTEMRKIAFSNDNIQPDLNPRSLSYAPDLLSFNSATQTNWNRYFFHKATPLRNGHIRLSGSIGRILFNSSLGLRNEEHLLKGNFFSKQLTSNQQFRYQSENKNLNITSSIYYSAGKNVSTASPAILRAISLPPNYPPLHDNNGKLNWEYNGVPISNNPAAYLLQTYAMDVSGIQTATKVEYLITKDISVSTRAGYSSFTTHESALYPAASFSQHQQLNVRAIYGSGKFATTVLEPQFEYKWNSKKFSLIMMAGITLQHHSIFLETKRGTGYRENTQHLTLANAMRIEQGEIRDKNIYESLLARASLKISARYILDLTGRRENSSHFSTDAKTGSFFAAGLGWIFSEESFLKKYLSFLNYGKIRVSYGTTGNDNIGYRHFMDSRSRTATYTINQAASANLSGVPFGWSVTQKAEAGLEFYTINNRLSFIVSSFFHRTGKQLISQLSSNQNTSLIYLLNYPAVVHNRGIEITAGYRSSGRNRVQWTSQLTITSHKNYLNSFEDLETSLYAGRYWLAQSLDARQPLRFEGVDPATGIYRFYEDKSLYITTTPKIYGGFQQSFGAGRWKADFQFDFRCQTGVNHLAALGNNPPGTEINQPLLTANYWQNPGDLTGVTKPTASSSSPTFMASLLIPYSDAVYNEASFLRLRNFLISYTLNSKKALVPAHGIQFYLQLQNLWTLTRFPLSDPETQSFYSHPRTATITAGVIINN